MHTRMYAGFGGERIERPLSEFLEHLASDNGADMHKYNTLYTRTLSLHVLTPTSFYHNIPLIQEKLIHALPTPLP